MRMRRRKRTPNRSGEELDVFRGTWSRSAGRLAVQFTELPFVLRTSEAVAAGLAQPSAAGQLVEIPRLPSLAPNRARLARIPRIRQKTQNSVSALVPMFRLAPLPKHDARNSVRI